MVLREKCVGSVGGCECYIRIGFWFLGLGFVFFTFIVFCRPNKIYTGLSNSNI